MHPIVNPHLYTLPDNPSRDEVLTRLAGMPRAVRAAVASASPESLARAPAGEWSAFQTICHFRDAALVYSARFRFIIFNDDPLLTNYDEENWVTAARDTPGDIPGILDEIAASRSDLIRVLARLDEPAWRRTGRHEVAGALILEDYVRHQLAHERQHLAQIQDAITPHAPPHE